MSKRSSVGGTPNNTLLKYFTKSPATSTKKPLKTEEIPKKIVKVEEEDSPSTKPSKCHASICGESLNIQSHAIAKRQLDPELSDSDQEDDIIIHKKKRPKVARLESDDDADSDRENDSDNKQDKTVSSTKSPHNRLLIDSP